MPLRSPKMYSFIFGFQRRTWCPKWTPASSSSFIVTETKLSSPSRELVMYSPRHHALFTVGPPTRAATMVLRISNFELRISEFVLRLNSQSEIRNSQLIYRLENWKRLRAPFWPYFFRSLMRGSRVINPACFNCGRRSALNSSNARVIPCRIAPA